MEIRPDDTFKTLTSCLHLSRKSLSHFLLPFINFVMWEKKKKRLSRGENESRNFQMLLVCGYSFTILGP